MSGSTPTPTPPAPGFTPEPVPHPVPPTMPGPVTRPVTPVPVPAKLTPEDRITALELHVFGGPPEVNQQIQVGDTMTIPITAEDAQQAVKPLLAGDTFMARSSDPLSLKAGIGAAKGGGPALIVQGLRAAVRVLAFVTDAKGLRQVVGRFDVVAPVPSVVTPPEPAVETEPVPVSLALDMGAAETEEPSPPSP